MLPEEMIIGVLVGVGVFFWLVLVFFFIITLELGSIAKTLKMIMLVIYDQNTPGMSTHMEKLRRKLEKRRSK